MGRCAPVLFAASAAIAACGAFGAADDSQSSPYPGDAASASDATEAGPGAQDSAPPSDAKAEVGPGPDADPDAPIDPCTDGWQNGAETDVDCGGGTCTPCQDGKHCVGADDCESPRCLFRADGAVCSQ